MIALRVREIASYSAKLKPASLRRPFKSGGIAEAPEPGHSDREPQYHALGQTYVPYQSLIKVWLEEKLSA